VEETIMMRTGLTMLSVALATTLGACASASVAEQATTPTPAPVSPEPTQPLVAEPTQPPAAEPTKAPEPPPAPTYLHGKWVWFELNTSDPEAASKFYAEVLGWTIEPKEMNTTKYSAIMVGGKELGMIQALPADAKEKKLTPSWMGYISVADVDAAVTTATGGGGTVHIPATDVPGMGRFAIIRDPWGALFGVVKTNESDIADGVPGPGEFIWTEHLAKDAKKAVEAQTFYASIAGYETKAMKVDKMDYGIGAAGGIDRIGFMKAEKAAWAGKFVTYTVVADVDATVKLATKLKGKVLAKARDIAGVGRLAMLADPQGAVFAVMAPAPMPSEGAAAATPAP